MRQPSFCLAFIALSMGKCRNRRTSKQRYHLSKGLSAIEHSKLCVFNLSQGLWCAFDVISGRKRAAERLERCVGHIRRHESKCTISKRSVELRWSLASVWKWLRCRRSEHPLKNTTVNKVKGRLGQQAGQSIHTPWWNVACCVELLGSNERLSIDVTQRKRFRPTRCDHTAEGGDINVRRGSFTSLVFTNEGNEIEHCEWLSNYF